eukprot:5873673-Prymnesium_polylepis.1
MATDCFDTFFSRACQSVEGYGELLGLGSRTRGGTLPGASNSEKTGARRGVNMSGARRQARGSRADAARPAELAPPMHGSASARAAHARLCLRPCTAPPPPVHRSPSFRSPLPLRPVAPCLLYTSDAADDM